MEYGEILVYMREAIVVVCVREVKYGISKTCSYKQVDVRWQWGRRMHSQSDVQGMKESLKIKRHYYVRMCKHQVIS